MKKIGIILLIVIALAFITYKYMYQDHRDIQSETATFVTEASSIAQEFLNDQTVASQKYLNKTIQLTGKVTEIEQQALTLSESVYTVFDTPIEKTIAKGDQLTVKGRCIGYDELLEVIRVDQTSIID